MRHRRSGGDRLESEPIRRHDYSPTSRAKPTHSVLPNQSPTLNPSAWSFSHQLALARDKLSGVCLLISHPMWAAGKPLTLTLVGM